MINKIIIASMFSVFTISSLGFTSVSASEVLGTLSSNNVSSNTSSQTTGGSLSGSVSGGVSVSGGTSGGSNSGGQSFSSSGGSGFASVGQVLGASTDIPSSYPGLPNTGRGGIQIGYTFLLATALFFLVSPKKKIISQKS